jgi:hypothetical protein
MRMLSRLVCWLRVIDMMQAMGQRLDSPSSLSRPYPKTICGPTAASDPPQENAVIPLATRAPLVSPLHRLQDPTPHGTNHGNARRQRRGAPLQRECEFQLEFPKLQRGHQDGLISSCERQKPRGACMMSTEAPSIFADGIGRQRLLLCVYLNQ